MIDDFYTVEFEKELESKIELRKLFQPPNVLKRQEVKRIRKENREKMPDLPQKPLSKNGLKRQRKYLQRINGINEG
jgi:hypothetical protein